MMQHAVGGLPRLAVWSVWSKRSHMYMNRRMQARLLPGPLPRRGSRQCRRIRNSAAADDKNSPGEIHRVVEGDIVTIHYRCRGPDGEVLDSSWERDEAISFQVGAGDVVGNKLFQGFDEAVRGMQVGETVELEASGGDWNRELLFKVPRDHEEIQRLEGRYRSQGGIKEGMLVELLNGQMALVVHFDEEVVGLDANSMMAGKAMVFELEVVGIDLV